jgi:hypothetical protein
MRTSMPAALPPVLLALLPVAKTASAWVVTGTSGTGPRSGGAGGGEQVAEGGNAGVANGGAPPEQPPYDCVLHPKTHLEIINACTDATRIEKHPELPAIP